MIENDEFLKKYESFKEYKDYLRKVEPGTILISDEKIGLLIKAKDAIITVNEIQGENAKRMNIKDFLRGNKLDVGEILCTI